MFACAPKWSRETKAKDAFPSVFFLLSGISLMSELLPNKPRGPEGHPEDSEEHLSQCFRSKRLSLSLLGQHINAMPWGGFNSFIYFYFLMHRVTWATADKKKKNDNNKVLDRALTQSYAGSVGFDARSQGSCLYELKCDAQNSVWWAKKGTNYVVLQPNQASWMFEHYTWLFKNRLSLMPTMFWTRGSLFVF